MHASGVLYSWNEWRTAKGREKMSGKYTVGKMWKKIKRNYEVERVVESEKEWKLAGKKKQRKCKIIITIKNKI